MSGLGYVLPAASLGLGALLLRPQRGFFQAGDAFSPILIPQAVPDEKHIDRLQITRHPVEVGATISDHAFKMPARVVITCLWSNSPPGGGIFGLAGALGATLLPRPLGTAIGVASSIPSTLSAVDAIQSILRGDAQNQCKEIYQQLLDLQNSRVLFDVYTGKRSYRDMLIEAIEVDTRRETENVLFVHVECEQVILVDTQTVNVPMNTGALKDPPSNMPTADTGARGLGDGSRYNPAAP